jgi:hypothetical protein
VENAQTVSIINILQRKFGDVSWRRQNELKSLPVTATLPELSLYHLALCFLSEAAATVARTDNWRAREIRAKIKRFLH